MIYEGKVVTCSICGKRSEKVSEALGICGICLKGPLSPEAENGIRSAHARSRTAYGFCPSVPASSAGKLCRLCANHCRIGPGEEGYCGLREFQDNKLHHLGGTAKCGVLEYYFDPLPTNCVADWVCAGSQRKGEYNLAVFLGACSFDCLFCQNIQYRRITKSPRWRMAPEDLAGSVRLDTACICYFGGDPSPQLPFALKASELALDIGRDRKLHICWETNGSMHPGLLRKAVEQSLRSGGCVKFDLKAYDERLHIALCGVSNKITLSNFSWVASRYGRREPPLLIASTLLVPGYVEADEVERIARFIASCDQEIPYSLLAFYPCHLMQDMPVTSKRQAGECLQAAREAGLKRVRLGNVHLLR